jgi:hypothetical protein
MLQLTLANPGHAQHELITIYPEAFYTTLLEAAMLCGFDDFITQAKDVGGIITGITRCEDFDNDFIEVAAAPTPNILDLVHLYIGILNAGVMVISLLSFFFGKVNIRMNAPGQGMVNAPDFHYSPSIKFQSQIGQHSQSEYASQSHS